MKRSNNYNTKQKDIILNSLKKYDHEFTVKELYNDLNQEIGLTTIYRYIDKLLKEEIINKNIGRDNITYYQYLEKCNNENHFYLKCESCGKMEHIDCDCITTLTNHILENHKFVPTKDHIIINGLCNKCNSILGR